MSDTSTYNDLPKDKSIYAGEQRRRTNFDSPAEKLTYDAKGLILRAQKRHSREVVTVDEALCCSDRMDDDIAALRREIAILIENPGDKAESASVAGSTELSPERKTLLGTLKERYERNQHKIDQKGKGWADVEAKLIAAPEKIDALKALEDSGGEPDVYKMEGDDFTFGDLAIKLPDCRKDVSYLTAFNQATGWGVSLMSADDYKMIGNDLKIKMDTDLNWVWLDTPENILSDGNALVGHQNYGNANVYQHDAHARNHDGAFRCSLRV